MELKEGYKQTEVGVIPEDWEIRELGKIGKFSKGQGIRKDESQSGEIPCVRYGELYTRHNDYVKRYYSFISDSVAQTSKKLKKGDILFAGSGETKAEIGKCAAFVDDIDVYVGGDVVLFSPVDCNSLFLGYLLNAPFIARQKASRGQGDAVVHISAGQLQSISIPLPPTKAEQTAIATALSDTDALISRLETLIAKKRAIKQGAMQQLLKPKEGWVVKKLEDCLLKSPSYGINAPSVAYSDVLPTYIRITDISEDGRFMPENRTSVNHSLSANYILESGDIVFARTGASVGKSYLYKESDELLVYAGFLIRVKTNPEVLNPLYFQNFTTTGTYWSWVKVMSMRSGQPGINGNEFKQLEIPVPSTIEEQTYIAQILSNMDAEIAGLEQKLSKYKRLKQGMMQELLTGKTRLV